MSHRIKYKIATVCYNIVSSSAPPYCADLQLYTPSWSVCSSADSCIFHIPMRCKKSQGQHTFHHTGPVLWNSLIFCSPCSDSIKLQITTKSLPLLHLFSSTIVPALFKSQPFSVHACVCVCVCINVMWESYGVIRILSLYPNLTPAPSWHCF